MSTCFHHSSLGFVRTDDEQLSFQHQLLKTHRPFDCEIECPGRDANCKMLRIARCFDALPPASTSLKRMISCPGCLGIQFEKLEG